MAESLIFAVAESLIVKLASRAVEQASLALGVYQDLQQMKKTMAMIKAFLLDAEQKRQQNNALSEWLRQIRQVFARAEDIVDNFECEVLRKRVVNTHGSFSRKVCRLLSTKNPVIYRFIMGREIKDIKKQLEKVLAYGHMFGLQSSDNDTVVVHTREMTHSHVNVSNVVGREHDKQKIIELLLQDGDYDRSVSVTSIVGFGGSGKTTLAKVVFNDTKVEEFFTLKMWVCVSNDFELRNVLIKILNSAPNPTNEKFKNLETDQLQNRLRNTLHRQKFLLVLDDVWNENHVKWGELKEIIDMVGDEGSKILVTTRSHSIDAMMRTKSSNSYFLKGLSEEDSLSLFVKSAFDDGEGKNHPELMEIGRQIVRKCGGIPLAVRTLGSSLFSRVDKKEWENIRDNEIWNLKQNENDILPALELSYDQLPSHLKRCFACFSLASKDFDVSSSYVALLWEALGFLSPSKESKTTHDVANEFLRELWSRSFLTDFLDMGSTCRFKLHDLVRDLAVYVAKGNQKLKGLPDSVCKLQNLQTLDLRGCIKVQKLPKGIRKLISLRRLLVTTRQPDFPDKEISNLASIETLELYSCDNLESLFQAIQPSSLKFLHLSGCGGLKSLSFHVIANLESLVIFKCSKMELSMGLSNLSSIPDSRLKLLVLQSLPQLVTLPEWLQGSLNTLHSLLIVDCNNLEELPEWLSTLTCLKLLIIEHCPRLITLPDSTRHLRNLEHLEINDCPELCKRCQPGVGLDWHKISHIKQVIIGEPEE
ncbi:disease resistance protein RGA2-like isoform X2 [Phaseolus vulgaris]|uniref:disease resistance protein RGA2-like isoform X2 n=1 Tax=Phaseolus vulgaris TaxID=3885 RepID=UPI0035CBEA23